jgi:paraquat-inducible protein B
MGRKANPTVIGAFVVAALVLAVLAIAFFGSGRLFRKTSKWVLFFDRSVNGLRVGAPVKFKGVEIGTVNDIRLNLGEMARGPKEAYIPVIIAIDSERVREKGGRVMDLTPEVGRQLVDEGLRAQLSTESFVTGVLYVELDFFPGTPATLVNEPTVPFPEIPTLPTALEQVQAKASEIITKLGEVDLKGLVESLKGTVEGLDRLVNSPEIRKVVDELDETLQTAREALGSVRSAADGLTRDTGPLWKSLRATSDQADASLRQLEALITPGAPLSYQVGETLRELGDAARALRVLAELLERDPSVLIRGRARQGDK